MQTQVSSWSVNWRNDPYAVEQKDRQESEVSCLFSSSLHNVDNGKLGEHEGSWEVFGKKLLLDEALIFLILMKQ